MILQRLAPFSRSERRTNASEVIAAYRLAQRKISFYQWRRFRILEKFTMDDMFRPILGRFWPRWNPIEALDFSSRWICTQRPTRSIVDRCTRGRSFILPSLFPVSFFSFVSLTRTHQRITAFRYTSRYQADNFSSLFYFLIFPRVSFEIDTSC